jgi:hypothetical protein
MLLVLKLDLPGLANAIVGATPRRRPRYARANLGHPSLFSVGPAMTQVFLNWRFSLRHFTDASNLVHLHPRHGRVIHVVVSLIVIVCGPDFLGVSFVRVYVDHPSEYMREEYSAGGVTGFFGVNGT